jgi:hypothetical protein
MRSRSISSITADVLSPEPAAGWDIGRSSVICRH